MSSEGNFVYESGKTYTHAQGLSCCFRQWRADSHCRFLHGYALQVTITFRSPDLNDKNWVQDFGSLKPVKQWLEDTFDHKLLLAKDDPNFDYIYAMTGTRGTSLDTRPEHKIADVRIVEAVGCEAFAKMIFERVDMFYPNLDCVEVREHEGNFARYRRQQG